MSSEAGGTHGKFPAGYLPYDEDSMTSVYLKDYRGLRGERSQQLRRQREAPPAMPFDATSTSKTDFQVWPRSTVQSFKPAKEQPKSVPFSGSSLYADEFKPLKAEVRTPFKPSTTVAQSVPFTGSTTTREDYPFHQNVERPKPAIPLKSSLDSGVETRSFETESSTYSGAYAPVRRSFKPSSGSYVPTKFEGGSVSRADFHAFPGVHASASCKPSQTRDAVPETRSFKSEAHDNFAHKDGRPAEMVRPPRTTIQSQRFDAVPTSRVDYVRFDGVKPPESFKPKTQEGSKVPDSRDFLSESRKNFVPLKAEPAKSYKQRSEYVRVPEDREFLSETRHQLQNTGVDARRQPFKPQATVSASVPFDAASTHQLDFSPLPLAARRSFKPTESLHRTGEDRDFTTEQRSLAPFAGLHAAKSCKPTITAESIPDDRVFKSEASSNYTHKDARPAAMVRPPRTTIERIPFEASTTARTDFPRYDGVKPSESCKPKLQDATSSPDSRDFLSESRKNFIPLKAEPAQSFKPSTMYNQTEETRDFQSETRDKLRDQGVNARREPFKPNSTVSASLPFDASSTHHTDYVPLPTATRRPYKPSERLNRLGEDRDFATEHRDYMKQYETEKYLEGLTRRDGRAQGNLRYIK